MKKSILYMQRSSSLLILFSIMLQQFFLWGFFWQYKLKDHFLLKKNHSKLTTKLNFLINQINDFHINYKFKDSSKKCFSKKNQTSKTTNIEYFTTLDTSEMFLFFSNLISLKKIKISKFQIKEQQTDNHFIITPIHFSFLGAYQQTMAFLQDIEESKFLLNIKNIVISKNKRNHYHKGKLLKVDLLINIYNKNL